ncbi:conserved domain protein [delta proteobacterium NaphS2]|nr:conserved domain protein [delta proteobacterium NaphS2]EFK11366.1 conserved domain protein [delta proteobacterium NaphS2]
MVTKMHHVAVFVSDMERSLHLFRDISGIEILEMGGSGKFPIPEK